MRILTRNGYIDIKDCSIGDEVLYYDLYTGAESFNTIENIEILTGKNYPDTTIDVIGDIEVEKTVINEETGEEETITVTEQGKIGEELITNNRNWYVVNGQYEFFALQSVWANLNVKHAKDLAVGDIIYDDSDNDIIITSITSFTDDDKTFYRMSISGDSSFIADNITLHNASRYHVTSAATSVWDATTTNWSASSGGTGGASVPTSADDVFFNNLSYASAYTCTIQTVVANCASITLANPNTGALTLAGSVALNCYGSFTISSTITRTYTGAISMLATTTGKTFTTGGVSLANSLSFNSSGVGSWTTTDNLVNTSQTSFLGGSLTLGGNITTAGFTSNGSNTCVLSLGSYTFSSSANCLINNTGLTINAGTSNWLMTATGLTLTIRAVGETLYTLSNTASGSFTVSGGNLTCTNFTRTGTAAKTDTLVLGGNLTVTGTLALNGNSAINRLLVNSSVLGTARTITCNGTFNKQHLDLRDITGAGSISWDLSAITGLSGDCGGNSGITFTSPVTTTCSAGTTWSTATWSSRVPLPQDTAMFSGTTRTILVDMARIGSLDTTGSTGITISGTSACGIYGSLNFTNAANETGAGTWTLSGRGTNYINLAGQAFARTFIMDCKTGTYTLNADFSNNNTITITSGTFNTNGYVLQCASGLTFSAGSTINLGSSTVICSASVPTISASCTLDCGTSTIKLTSSTSTIAFNGNGKTFYKLWNATTGTATFTIAGNNTFDNITTDVGRGVIITAGTTQTFTGAGIVINGTGTQTTIGSTTSSAFTLVKSGGGTVVVDNCSISYSTASPANTWYATNSVNGGNNTNWTFGSPPSGGGATAFPAFLINFM